MLLLALLACPTPRHPTVTGEVQTHTLSSEAVGDDYQLYVRLPPGYDPQGAHPVVLQLDPYLGILPELDVTSGFASELEASGAIAPTLVVGVGYPPDPGPVVGRMRDYTPPDLNGDSMGEGVGGSEDFLAFLSTELSPWLEDNYAVAGPEDRAIFGHSLGGLFTTWAMLSRDTQPEFVHDYVAASPSYWWDSGSIFQTLESTQVPIDADLLMTSGYYEGPEMVVYFEAMNERLEGVEGLHLHVASYPEDHVGTVSPSFEDGLRLHFGGAP